MLKKEVFRRRIRAWYGQNKRDLPWREVNDPYPIWVSEIILQQTRVEQGLAYYHRFLKQFPTVKALAKAKDDQVMKMWEGLGYYSRARNMHHAARTIVDERGGIFPDTYNEIIRLKGVGEYTAAAIASFAFNEAHAVVDGNVYRLLSRLYGIATPIDSTLGKKQFSDLAADLLDRAAPGEFNQAIMEFGSQYCKPKGPDCSRCIFADACAAYRSGKAEQLPVKAGKTRVKKRYFHYAVIIDAKEKLLIHKRTGKDIWQGLYEFPLYESERPESAREFLEHCGKRFGLKKATLLHSSGEYKHVLSHRVIRARFHVFRIRSQHLKKTKSATINSLTKFAFPRLIEKFLSDCNLHDLC